MAQHTPRRRRDDDIDDFMASIFKNEATPKPAAPLFARKTKPEKQVIKPAPRQKEQIKPYVPKSTYQKNIPRASTSRVTFGKPLLAGVIVIAFVSLIVLAWQGPLQSILSPSPFSKETKQKMGDTPLYFPQSLPKGYKIEKDTMKFPSDKVVVFAASDDTGNAITFSLQSKPSGLNTKPFTDKLTSTTSLKTDEGEATIGDDTDGKRIVSYVTDKIWLLITVRKDQIPAQELEAIVKSLKEG